MSKHRRSPVALRALPMSPSLRSSGAALAGSAVLAAGLLPFTAGAALAGETDHARVADLPADAVRVGDRPAGDDHIGFALAGLGALGLAGAATAGAVAFRRPQRDEQASPECDGPTEW